MTVENRSALRSDDRLLINTQTTRRYAEMMASASETERWAKKVRLAVCRINVQESGPPKLSLWSSWPISSSRNRTILGRRFRSRGWRAHSRRQRHAGCVANPARR